METVELVPQEMCLNVGRFVNFLNSRFMAKVFAEGPLKNKKVCGGNDSGTTKLAAIGSHIPHQMGNGHWTISHILANSTRLEFSNERVADKPISTLDPRKTTTVHST